MNAEPWKLHTDTAEHFKLFQILRGYSNGVYTKADMREKFKKLDLKNYSSFRPAVKAQIDEILKEDTPSRKPNKKRAAEEIAEESVTEIDPEG